MSECQESPGGDDAEAQPVPLSREAITNAAIDFIEEYGLDRLSMRTLAGALACGTMSLYSHVRNRDDLIAAIVHELLDRSGILEVTRTEFPSWQALITASLLAYRDLAAAYPGSFELLALAPYDVAPVAEHLEGLVDALNRAGVPDGRAYEVLGALDAYATGFLMVWARSRAKRAQADGVASARLTGLRELERFERGLAVFVAGFERELDPGAVSESATEAGPGGA